MTRQAPILGREDVALAIKLLADNGKQPPCWPCHATSTWPTPPSAATSPDITADLSQQRALDPAGATPFQRLQHHNGRLRGTNHALSEHLDLAVANIQRLTLENHQLEAATTITRRHTRHRPPPPGTLIHADLAAGTTTTFHSGRCLDHVPISTRRNWERQAAPTAPQSVHAGHKVAPW